MSKDALRDKWVPKTSDSNDSPEAENTPAPANDSTSAKSKYFGVDTNSPYLASVKYICRTGRVMYLPYSLQPVVEYIPEEGIHIKTMQKEVHITGTGLRELADWLGAQKVIWVKESISGVNDESEVIFVKSISIKTIM